MTAGKIVEGHEPPATIQPFASGRFSTYRHNHHYLWSLKLTKELELYFFSGFQCLAGRGRQSRQMERFLNQNIWNQLSMQTAEIISILSISTIDNPILKSSYCRCSMWTWRRIWRWTFALKSQISMIPSDFSFSIKLKYPRFHPISNSQVICEWTGAGVTTLSSRCPAMSFIFVCLSYVQQINIR